MRLEVPCDKVPAALLVLRACYSTSYLEATFNPSSRRESDVGNLMLLVNVIAIAEWQADSVMQVRARIHTHCTCS